ncbi:uncharacterized protein E0L32_001467 [Thyridium curvatum]|uniref:Uncharacterized protein n=1 Tax=Thyridium curvatum TaxID=1093900 RepID=A0A507B144_9PEZI|nr:uncharacterized protein E0L32_001467 [Thyridium curvatum]TPX10270.1 hypothetical protein E0L32_001467 [Thyridium curvatum]
MLPSLLTTLFTITAQPGTDIWRKPPSTDVFNGKSKRKTTQIMNIHTNNPKPLLSSQANTNTQPSLPPAPTSHAQTNPLSAFRSARVSFTGTWTHRYDQAGMALSLHRSTGTNCSSSSSSASSSASAGPSTPPKWVKTGIEYYQDQPRLSTVTCDAWADWSVALPAAGTAGPGQADRPVVTLLARREADELGTSLWVYQVVPAAAGNQGEEEVLLLPMRECAWAFAYEDDEDWMLTVAAYAARPDKNTTETLEVAFQELNVEWAVTK